MKDEVETVDARGLSCPHPVMLASGVIKKVEKGTIEVLVDSGTARENVSRLASTAGWAVTVEEQPGGEFRIVLER